MLPEMEISISSKAAHPICLTFFFMGKIFWNWWIDVFFVSITHHHVSLQLPLQFEGERGAKCYLGKQDNKKEYWTEVKMKIKEKIKTKIVIQVTGRGVEEKSVAYQFLIVFFLNLRHNWHITPCNVEGYSVLLWYIYINFFESVCQFLQ